MSNQWNVAGENELPDLQEIKRVHAMINHLNQSEEIMEKDGALDQEAVFALLDREFSGDGST